jgi:hypothetical protein
MMRNATYAAVVQIRAAAICEKYDVVKFKTASKIVIASDSFWKSVERAGCLAAIASTGQRLAFDLFGKITRHA